MVLARYKSMARSGLTRQRAVARAGATSQHLRDQFFTLLQQCHPGRRPCDDELVTFYLRADNQTAAVNPEMLVILRRQLGGRTLDVLERDGIACVVVDGQARCFCLMDQLQQAPPPHVEEETVVRHGTRVPLGSSFARVMGDHRNRGSFARHGL